MNPLGWMRRLWRRRQVEADMREEMDFHREARIADLVSRGVHPDEASRTARMEFGSAETYREECREELGYRPWDEMSSDLRFAVRGIRKNPGFAFASFAILLLAIGVNAVFFSIYSNYVLKSLPFRGAERHFSVEGFDRHGRSTYGWNRTEADSFRQALGTAVEGLYASDTFQVMAIAPRQGQTMITSVSGSYFRLLGAAAEMGRTLSEGDESEPIVVLSSAGAARFFPSRPNPVGEKVRVRSTIMTVVGVMPAAFTGTVPIVPDFWVGIGLENQLRGQPSSLDKRGDLHAILAPGVSREYVQSILTVTASNFFRAPAEGVARVDLRANRSLLPDDETLSVAAALIFALFWMVLLVACANLANLHLARAAARTHEIATRLSLGASRWRIVRQLLTESTLTAMLSAAGGCLLAVLAVQHVHAYAVSLPGVSAITIPPISTDWRVLLYSGLLGLAAGLACGLLPALEITSPNLALSSRRESGLFSGRIRPRRIRDLLIGGQVALSLVLLMLSGLLIRNVQRLGSVEAGYDLNRVFDVKLDQPNSATVARVAEQTGVGSVTAVERVPLYGRMYRLPVTVDNVTVTQSYNRVDHRYFETLELPVQGRGFTTGEASSRAKVAVISQATSQGFWGQNSALGQTLTIEWPNSAGASVAEVYQVVGVVPDVVSGWWFEGKDSSMIYLPAASGQPGMGSLMARIVGDPVKTATLIREVCASAANATGCEPESLAGLSVAHRFPFKFAAGVAGALGGLALLLTAIGLYSVTSFSVAQRKRELGVLMALGATPRQVIRRILVDGWRCIAFGIAVGLPICLILSKFAASSVFQISTFDVPAYISVLAVLLLVTTLACGGPALRAARMDPMRSLRED